jgi:uncharacterized repeat protein (TIGR01451 family)
MKAEIEKNLMSAYFNRKQKFGNLFRFGLMFVLTVFFFQTNLFAQYTRNFEDGTTGASNCIVVSDVAVGSATSGRTQANPVIAGTWHGVSGQLTTSNKFYELPWLSLSSGASLTFKHKRQNTTTTNAFLEVSITSADGSASNVIWTFDYATSGAAQTVFNPTVSLGVTGVYKIRIRGGGTNGSTRYAIDDISVSNAVQSTVGVGSANTSACNPVIPGVTAPIANNDSATTPLDTPTTFSISGNDTPQTNALNPARIDLDPTTSAIDASRTVSGQGTFAVDSSGNVTFTPDSGYVGTSSINYTIRDTAGAISNSATIAVTVTNQSFACSDALYFTSSSNTNVYRYTPSTNSLIQLSGITLDYGFTEGSAAAGITPGGDRLYFNDRQSPRQLRYNTGNTSNPIVAAQVDNSISAQRAAIDSLGNGFYMLGAASAPATYYRFTTGGTTSTITGPFTFTLAPSTAPAVSNGGDIAFDANNVGYLVDQSRNLYRLDITANTATFLGGITGMGTASPNGVGFSGNNLYISTLTNTLYQVDLTTLVASLRTPSSTPSGFAQNDIATCIYPANLVPDVAAAKAYRNVTKNDPTDFSVSSNADPGDTLEYRVVVRNSGTIAAGNTTFQDSIPSGVTYVANSTTLNGSAVTDLAGTGNARFNYQTAKNINSPGSGIGVLDVDSTPATLTDNEAIVIFRVTVNNPFNGTANPIPNIAQVNYAGASAVINSNTVNTNVVLSISGKVFEDVNYGGGAGRDLTTSGGTVRQNTQVELYNSSGNFVSSTTTNATGDYSFTGLAAGNYTVRVVNSTVTSSRTGYVAGLLPVQTFRTDASTGIAVADVNRVGGETPSLVDAASNTTSATLASLTTSSATAQSISPVTLGSANITELNFGYNFSTIVNRNNSGQGSLRQFILNSNALSGNGSLNQSGSTINTRGANSSLPSGRETSIFMIPNGTARPGLRSGLTNQLTGGVAVIQVSSTLPSVSDGDTIIDGGTQTFNVGNTNTTTLNSATTVGIDNLSVPAIGGPEVQIQPTSGFYATAASGLTLAATATNTTIQSISILGFTADTVGGTDQANIYLNSGSSALIRWNVVGSSATSYTDPGAGARTVDYGVLSRTGNLTLEENIVAFVGAGGFELFSATSSTLVQANEMRGNAIINSSAENLNLQTGSSGARVEGNLSVNAGGPGFDTSGAVGSNIFINNTVTGNGTLTTGQTSGIRLQGANNRIEKNIIGNNYGAGILVRYATTNTGNVITRNSIYGNGTTGGSPTKQIGIDLVATASESGNAGTFPFVTINDANDTDSGPNNLLNFPVFESVTVSGGNLVLKGCAPAGATIELFESDVSPGKSSTPGANTNSPRTLDYGEGEAYLLTLTEGGIDDTDSGTGCAAKDGNDQTGMARFSFTIALPSGVSLGDLLTATATFSGSGTSEFSPVVRVANTPPNVGLVKSCPLPADCTTAPQLPGTDITYEIEFTNTGGQGAANLQIVDGIPDNMDYKIGSAVVNSGLTFTIEFSSDYDPATPAAATWTYTPVSGGGNTTVGFAPVGYDRLVRAIRWRTTDTLSNVSPTNTGDVTFITKIR